MKETDINKWTTLIIEKIEGLQQDWNNECPYAYDAL